MLSAIFWLVVGLAVGWNFPQPQFAKNIQEKITSFFNK